MEIVCCAKETIHHIYNSEKEIKSTTTVDICNNQEDYDPTLVLITDNIDSDKAKVLENSKDIRKEITKSLLFLLLLLGFPLIVFFWQIQLFLDSDV
jgi:uncharacterized protein YegL